MGASSTKPSADTGMAKQLVDTAISEKKVLVFSKTYCPYCKMAKDVLNQAGASPVVFELDTRDDGDAIQDYLLKVTGGRTVPRVFIGGEFIGGGTEVRQLHDQNKLVPKLKEVGAL